MSAGLWDFSLAIYEAPGVAPLCLSLQAEFDADVNVLLCAAWIGATGRGRLDRTGIAALDERVAPLRERVVKPLRGARTWLKGELAADPALSTLRETIKRVELAAEREAQRLLEAWTTARPSGLGSTTEALANVEAYLAWRRGPKPVPDLTPLRAALAGLAIATPGE